MSLPLPAILSTAGAILTTATIVSHGAFVPDSTLWGPLISRGPKTNLPQIALTFDDGPTPGGTDRILDTLAEFDVKATFFVIGQNVLRAPALLQRIDAEGHLIGNHTFDHRRLSALRFGRFWREQIEKTDEAIANVIGKRPSLFRPPVGHKTPFTHYALRKTGHTMVTWSIRSYDGLKSATTQSILNRVLPQCGNGDIITLHDGCEPDAHRDSAATVAAIKPLVSALKNKGLRPVRLDEITGLCGYQI